MTKEELEEKNRELRDRLCNVANNLLDSWCRNEEAYCPHLAKLEKENSELKADNDARKFAMAMSEKVEKQLREENAELKAKVGLSIDCEKAQKNGELCLGYGGDEDEPCEQCKNCIKCECGYYQLGETEKDEQLTKAKEIIKELLDFDFLPEIEIKKRAEQFLKEE